MVSAPRHECANGDARDATEMALSALAEALSDAIVRRLIQPKRTMPGGEGGHSGGEAGAGGPADDEKR